VAVNLQHTRPGGAGQPARDGAAAGRRTSKGALRRAARRVPPFRGLLPLVAGLLIWQFFFNGSVLFPPPSAWWGATVELWDEKSLGPALVSTVGSFLGGLLLATVIGALLGLGVGRSRFLDRLLGPAFDFCRVLPAPAVVPLAVLFGGYTENSKLAVIVFASVWPVLLQVRTGARRLPLTLFETARTLRLSTWARLTKILLPAARHDILLGLRVAAPIALIATLLVELLTAIGGLGALVGRAQSSFHAAQVFGLIVLCGILGVLVSFAVSASESDEAE
jgi:ABC-type nitrate/sulfonate/bicarbonate transport system permease component